MRFLARLVVALVALACAGGLAFWLLTRPAELDASDLSQLAELGPGDPARGEHMFWAGGCASCHARPGAKGDARLELVGGVRLQTQFGTFVTPNISQDEQDGIGGWSAADLANAMLNGVSPDGRHFYPAFPYTSYARMRLADINDLHAFLQTLPAVKGRAGEHELSFPFTLRRGLGLWQFAFLDREPVVALPEADEQVLRGRYLVEGPGHCGECHTPRNVAGAMRKDEWLAGAPAATGKGNVPNITSGPGGIGDWSADDIAYFLESGFMPDFDSAGGAMAEVIDNTARLPAEDRAAIAAYLKAIPPLPNGY